MTSNSSRATDRKISDGGGGRAAKHARPPSSVHKSLSPMRPCNRQEPCTWKRTSLPRNWSVFNSSRFNSSTTSGDPIRKVSSQQSRGSCHGLARVYERIELSNQPHWSSYSVHWLSLRLASCSYPAVRVRTRSLLARVRAKTLAVSSRTENVQR